MMIDGGGCETQGKVNVARLSQLTLKPVSAE